VGRRSGLGVSIGELTFDWGGKFTLRRICLKNPKLQSDRCFIESDIASLKLELWPLAQKRIEIDSVAFSNFAMNFFIEKGGTKSWVWAGPVEGQGKSLGVKTELQIQRVTIDDGKINHEAMALPLPLGPTKFSAEAKASGNLKLSIKTEMPDGAVISGSASASSGQLPPQEAEGVFDVVNFSLAPIHPQLSRLSGKFRTLWKSSALSVKTESATISTFEPVKASWLSRGEILIAANGDILSGSGNVGIPGLAIQFDSLSRSAANGVQANYAGALELARFGEGQGTATFKGKIARAATEGSLSIAGFSRSGISCPNVTTTFSGVYAPEPSFLINGQIAEARYDSLSMGQLKMSPGQVSNVKFSATHRPGNITLHSISFDAFRGRVSGSATIASKIHLNANLMRFKAAEITRSLGFKAEVTSDLSGSASLDWQRDNAAASLSGALDLKFSRGRIKDSFFQRGILTGPLYKIEEKLVDVEFAVADVDLQLKSGAFSLRRFFFDAEEWSIMLRAEATNTGDGKAALDFRFRSSFVDNIANPIYLGISDRRSGDVYDLPFACRGNVFAASCYKQNWR